MTMPRNLLSLLVCTGLLLAPSAWIINTELGQILPYVDCRNQSQWAAVASFVGAAAAWLTALISWRSAHRPETSEPLPTLAFVSNVSALAALVFAFALSMQGLASVVLSGCER
jgi:hypothetical protein